MHHVYPAGWPRQLVSLGSLVEAAYAASLTTNTAGEVGDVHVIL